jgi:hypothetical protein
MKVELSYDAEADAWLISHQDVLLNTPADVAEWRRQVDLEFQKVAEPRVFLLICMHGVQVHPSVANEYGRNAKEIIGQRALGLVRFGDPGVLTTTSVLLQAVMNRYPSNVFPDRASALLALRKIRTLPD